ncbi:hypothetical protein D3C75_500750 [compost metagenome]
MEGVALRFPDNRAEMLAGFFHFTGHERIGETFFFFRRIVVRMGLQHINGLCADHTAVSIEQPVVRRIFYLLVKLVQLLGIPVDMAVGERKADFQIIGTGLLKLPQQRFDQPGVGIFARVNDVQQHKDTVIIHIHSFDPVGRAADFRSDIHNCKFVSQQVGGALIPQLFVIIDTQQDHPVVVIKSKMDTKLSQLLHLLNRLQRLQAEHEIAHCILPDHEHAVPFLRFQNIHFFDNPADRQIQRPGGKPG